MKLSIQEKLDRALQTNKIHISVMTGKLSGLRAINTNTTSNPFCQKMQQTDSICKVCYSQAMLTGSRKNCVPAFERNSQVLSRVIPAEQLPIIPDRIMRHDGHGELVNYSHMVNIHNLAIKNPETSFTLWTKRTDLIRQYSKEYEKPGNLIFIFSNAKIGSIRKVPRNFNKVFNVVYQDQHKKRQNCTGQKCIDCLLCYSHNGTSVIVEAIKKRG